MSNIAKLSSTSPAAPSSYVNVTWQKMVSASQFSGYVPNALSLDSDTSISSPASGDILSWNASISKWANKQPLLSADADVSISSPQDGQVLTYVAASSNWQNKTSGGGGASTNTQDLGMRFQWVPEPGATFGGSSSFGITAWASAGTVTNGSVAGALASAITFTTSAVATNSAGMTVSGSTGNGPLSLATLQSIVFAVKLSQTTNMRIWIGIANIGGSGGGTQLADFRSDTPGTSIALAMFRYSTAAGDSEYQCVTGSGSAQNAQPESTSSHVDATTVHKFMIQYSAPNVVFYIDNVQVGSQSLDAPSSSTNLFPQIWIDNVGTANAQAFNLYGVRGQWAGI